MIQQSNSIQKRELELIDISRGESGAKQRQAQKGIPDRQYKKQRLRESAVAHANAQERQLLQKTAKVQEESGEKRKTKHQTAKAKRLAAKRGRRRRGIWIRRVVVWVLLLPVCIVAGDFLISSVGRVMGNASPIAAIGKSIMALSGNYEQGIPAEEFAGHPEWEENFLTPNEYSRPGYALPKVTNIFVHYTANPGTSAAQNRSYFEQQKDTHERSVSSHFIIGYEGEIIQCVPLDEVAYAVKTRNYDSVSIECCYLAEDGSFTEATYDSLIELLAWLIEVYDLESEDILRHYDCGGKKCPLYYTENEDAWAQLKKDVDKL